MSAYSNITGAQNLPDLQQVFDSLDRLSLRLRENNQRVMINCRGSRDWCLAIASHVIGKGRALLFSNDPELPSAVPFSKAGRLLGSEADCVIMDGYSGVQVDVLCMASGLLRAGGFVLLLTSEHPQQMTDRYGVWQGVAPKQRYFLQYFFKQLDLSQWVMRQADANCQIDQLNFPPSAPTVFIDTLAEQQAQLFQQMQCWRSDRSRPVFILTADRGRGKSTLLGQFAEEVMAENQLLICAASKAHLGVLFDRMKQQDAQRCFMAPDEIIRRARRVEYLIVDEAAMLPAHVLAQCMALADKTLMATTTGGYEGTGSGFLLKFMAQIADSKKIVASLQQPIRWGAQDALEQWMNRVLMLQQMSPGSLNTSNEISIRQIDKAQLAGDKELLAAIYGLLVNAHYRTRPSDLRQLMEDENQQVWVACSRQQVLGVMLLNREGGFDEALSTEIFMGRRRPQGHLLAQMMTAQAGIKSFATLQGLRVQRIAVDEGCRRQGLGRQLIEAAIAAARSRGMDYIGSSFAIDATVLPFWRAMQFEALHISSGKGVATAQQTLAVVKPLNDMTDNMLACQREKTSRDLALWLQGYCRQLDWAAVLELLHMLEIEYHFNAQDEDELLAFTEGHRGLDYTLAVLQRLVISKLYRSRLEAADARLAIEKILQNKDWSAIAYSNGKKSGQSHLRTIMARLREL